MVEADKQNKSVRLDDGTLIDKDTVIKFSIEWGIDHFIREHLVKQEWWLVQHAWYLLLGAGDALGLGHLPKPPELPHPNDSRLLEIQHAIDRDCFKHKREHRSAAVERASFIAWARSENPSIEWLFTEWDGADGSFAAAERMWHFYLARLVQLWPEVRELRIKRGRGGDQKSKATRAKAARAMKHYHDLLDKGCGKKAARARAMNKFKISESTFYDWQRTARSK
jgi:hypothetical protein